MKNLSLLLVVLAASSLSSAARADGLIENLDGLFGFRWGMTKDIAKNVPLPFGVKLSCPDDDQIRYDCEATFPNANPLSMNKSKASSHLKLTFFNGRLAKLLLNGGDASLNELIIKFHTLFGKPEHSLSVLLDGSRLYSWVKKQTVINLEVGEKSEHLYLFSIVVSNKPFYIYEGLRFH